MAILENKVVLVTGASGGLGRTAARIFAREGATVIVAARREAECIDTVDQIRENGGTASFIKADITDDESIANLFMSIEAEYGRLDGALNNVGIQPDAHNTADLPLSEFDRTIKTNLRGTFLCLQQELRIMRKQGSGSVVNISSGGGFKGLLNSVAYCTSKFGIVGMSKAAALDMANAGIRINCLCPGAFRSPMLKGWTDQGPGLEDLLLSGIPMGRIAKSDEIAEAALWLMSDAASYVTGAALLAEGGLMAGVKGL